MARVNYKLIIRRGKKKKGFHLKSKFLKINIKSFQKWVKKKKGKNFKFFKK